MSRLVALALLAGWVGCTLVLSSLARLQRPSLVDRIGQYHRSGPTATGPASPWSIGSLRDLVTPLAEAVGAFTARVVGGHEPTALRLTRVHATVDVATVRLRQLVCGLAALGLAAAVTLVATPPPLLALGLLLGTPPLAALVAEHRLSKAARQWQRQLFLELPIVAEQLGMLLTSGWSLGGALARLGERGSGCCARDLARVAERTRHGMSDSGALAEWAEVARVDGVTRLVHVLSMHRDTTDLGRLITDEARSLRAEAHRELIATLDRRAQAVWIPVTVATLVPGVIFMAIPFITVMRVFARG